MPSSEQTTNQNTKVAIAADTTIAHFSLDLAKLKQSALNAQTKDSGLDNIPNKPQDVKPRMPPYGTRRSMGKR